ncbi:MAG TPA: potassium-transporting ATPase subunit F [Thermoplasmata archaeon]|nr:potassium-transporting ATPase subunit F [Thermoplasmata archaeon]HUJ78280.1 potassium-transporting ATPase subunit F [Thermoplasmata archaeon]
MDLVSTLAQNLGLVAFTVLSVGILLYLLYAMLNPTRF